MPWLSHEGLHEQSSMQMVWLNPARSSQSKFQETIVPRVIRVPHVPLRHLQSAKLCEMGLCASCREAPAVVLRFSCQRSSWLSSHLPADFKARSTFQSERSYVMGGRCCPGRPEGGMAFRRLRPLIAQAITSRPYTGR